MRKRDLIEFTVLGILAVTSLVVILFRGNSKVHYRLPSQPQVVREEITKISAVGESSGIELVKEGDQWMITSLDRAMDPGKADQLLNLLEASGPVDLISERSSGAEYGFTKDNLLILTVNQGDKVVRSWTLGNLSESGGYTYFRIGATGPVYSTRGDLRSILAADPESLRDRNIMTFDRDAVTTITYTAEGKTITLTKQEGIDNPTWTDASGKEYDINQVTNLLYRFYSLKCDSFTPETSAGTETARVEFNGPENTITIYGKTENRYLCRSSQSQDLFYLNEYAVNNVLKLFNPPPAE